MMKHLDAFIHLILPEHEIRHVFAAKVRLIAYLGFWVIYLFFMRSVLDQTFAVTAIILLCCLLTALAYLSITRAICTLPCLAIEMLSDLTVLTSVLYLTGGPHSPYFVIYILYVLVAGILYNHYLAMVVGLSSSVYYALFLLFCQAGMIPPLILDYGDHLPTPAYTPFAHFLLSLVLLASTVYIVKVASSFSQRREKILEKLNRQLEEANRVKSEFLATMSHELRTPLTAIIGFSELLTEGVMGTITDEQKEALQEVLHNAADLLEMINSLLDLTKIESGTMLLESRLFDMREAARRVSSTIMPLVQKKEQVFRLEMDERMEPLVGDERKIQQVMLNLLANANKFTPQRGEIALQITSFSSWDHIRERVALWARLKLRSQDFSRGGVIMTVMDNGVGIPEDQLHQVFEMFHQADSSSTRSFGGTGLGLSLARKFVEMHGGRIWAESELGKGARFTVILPRERPDRR